MNVNSLVDDCVRTRHRLLDALRIAVQVSWFAFVSLISLAASGQPSPQPPTDHGATASIGDSLTSAPSDMESTALDDLMNLADEPLESLVQKAVVVPSLDMEVTTVSRQESTVGHSAAAVFVMTNEMIRRSGARTVPDALRLVPGVQVARISASSWAITIRGFNGRFANKLLVQIDGRSVYTPLFAGVYWDVQDLVLEDVDRIEVIRGPGATVWGSNAVNGVINIITKSARETQGTYVHGGAGTEELGFATARVGGAVNDNTFYRVYGKWFERDQGYLPGTDPSGNWRQARTGFRIDHTPSACDTVTLQGDYYAGQRGTLTRSASAMPPDFTQTNAIDEDVSGENVLFRWHRDIYADSDWTVQLYYDRTHRNNLGTGFCEDRDTFDFDFQYRLPLTSDQALIWGLGYRNTKDVIVNSPFYITLTPDRRATDIISYFVQDEITLREDELFFTAGCKFEHNDYSQFEFQPTGRLLWTPTPRQSIWGAVSRAVRTPSRAEDDITITQPPIAVLPPPPVSTPVLPLIQGNRGLEAEDMLAYEAGIRSQPTDDLYWDFAVFYTDYRDIIGVTPGSMTLGTAPSGWPVIFVPMEGRNAISVQSYGFELAATYTVNQDWRVQGAYSFLRLNLDADVGVTPLLPKGNDPQNQFSASVSGNLGRGLQLDVVGRYVDSLPASGTPSYMVMDVRLARRFDSGIEAFVVGRNLLDAAHPEFGSDALAGSMATEVQHEIFGGLTWRR